LSKYKFKKPHEDTDIQEIQREVEDNFAIKDEVDEKETKVENVVTSEPKNNELSDGEKKIYYDGSDYWYYRKTGSKLLKIQMTLVE
jgi:hypothetical protein